MLIVLVIAPALPYLSGSQNTVNPASTNTEQTQQNTNQVITDVQPITEEKTK
jgi:hypothetical protein